MIRALLLGRVLLGRSALLPRTITAVSVVTIAGGVATDQARRRSRVPIWSTPLLFAGAQSCAPRAMRFDQATPWVHT